MSLEKVVSEFVKRFGDPPAIVTRAPGRVNLIGEHTDYNEGYVFPAAIDRYVWAAASPAESPEFHSIELDDSQGWSRYPEGVAWVLRDEGFTIPNLRAVVSGTVPIGAGVSSSAALELAFLVAWNELGNLDILPRTLARFGQRCENDFIGLRTGLMDQMASACGVADHAMFYDTRTQEIRYAHLPDGVAIVVCDTTKSRELAASKYNERRSECEAAADQLDYASLRDVPLSVLESAQKTLGDVLYRRARHVVTENLRCGEFFQALSYDLDVVGSLMKASHLSLRDDYEVSCPELDAMAEACWGAPGCIGARMTGAGFGGACVALAYENQIETFTAQADETFTASTGLRGRFMACRAADGARRVA